MQRLITLTFDNGPTEITTPKVLHILEKYKISSTFFAVGKNLVSLKGQDLIKLVKAGGHRIGNHTFSHTIPFGENTDPRICDYEVEKTQKLLGESSENDRLFRPFGKGGLLGKHLFSRALLKHIFLEKYTCVLWNCVPRDWENPDTWPETALHQCSQKDWSLVVLHDEEERAMLQLEAFIQKALDSGFAFVQEFPADCVPIRRGVPVLPIEHLTGNPAG